MAYGQDHSAQAFANGANGGSLHGSDFFRPVLFLAAAGLILGLIATLRISPLGAMFAGIVYTVSYAALLVAPARMLDLLNHRVSVSGHSADLSTPLRTGSALLVGAILIVATASRDRWRRWPDSEEALGSSFGSSRPVGVDGLGLNRPFDDLGPTRTPDDLDSTGFMSKPRAGAGSTRGGF
jgi:hypothetical protein